MHVCEGDELNQMLVEERFEGVPLLILANKQDLLNSSPTTQVSLTKYKFMHTFTPTKKQTGLIFYDFSSKLEFFRTMTKIKLHITTLFDITFLSP